MITELINSLNPNSVFALGVGFGMIFAGGLIPLIDLAIDHIIKLFTRKKAKNAGDN